MSLLIVISGVILFFALTRTEVGREGLRVELERQFSRSFNGRLEIRSLTGNLLNRLSASEVRVFDARGALLLRIDSVVVHPSWRDLFNRTISTGRITLLRPELNLRRDSSGVWNWQALAPASSRGRPSDPWAFHATHVEIVDGRVTTRSGAPPPDVVNDGWLFDYTNAEINSIRGRAIVDISSGLKLVDVLEMHAELPDLDLAVDSLRGQFLLEGPRLSIAETHLSIGDSDLHLSATFPYDGQTGADAPSSPRDDPAIELELASSTFDADELRRLIPQLPLRDAFTASARVYGPLDGLVVEAAEVRRGNSRIGLEGTLVGFPDSLDFQLALLPGSVRSRDLKAVWPDAPIPDFDQLGTITYGGLAEGTLQIGDDPASLSLDGHTSIQIESRAGLIEADLQIAGLGDSVLSASGRIGAADLNTGLLFRRPDLTSNLTGRIELDLTGSSLRESVGTLALSLGPSGFAGRRIDSLRAQIERDGGGLDATVTAIEGSGLLMAELTADSIHTDPRFRLRGRTRAFDLGNVLRVDSLASSLNTSFLLAGRGITTDTFEGAGSITFASSGMMFNGATRRIPAHQTTIEVSGASASGRTLMVGGDVLRLTASGDLPADALFQMFGAWRDAITAGFEHAYSKRYRQDSSIAQRLTQIDAPGSKPPGTNPAFKRHAGTLQVDLEIMRSDILSALIPAIPELRTDASANVGIVFDGSSASLSLQLAADSVQVASFRGADLNLDLRAEIADADSAVRSLDASLQTRASMLSVESRRVDASELHASYHDSGLELRVRADAPGASEPFLLDARLDILDDRNRIVIEQLQLAAREQAWRNEEPARLDLYQDALLVHGIRIERRAEEASPSEHVFISGVLSSARADTLFLRADDLSLEHLTGMVAGEYPLSGRLNGELAFTGLNRQPELTGRIDVTPLAYEDRVLGALTVTSRYIPGRPDVALHARLEPAESTPPSLTVEPSILTLDGTFRLPGGRTAAGTRDPGSLDLNVDVERADAFFFEYIFTGTVDDVSGALAGSGHIGGDFERPLFDSELELIDGGFRVPEFGLDYMAGGPLHVDSEGIHLDGIRVQDPKGGSALVSGSVLFNDYRFFSFALTGELDELRIMNVAQSRHLPFYGRIRSSGTVTLTGPLASATLQSSDVETTPDSELYIPITESAAGTDAGFIVFADSTGKLPDLSQLLQRRSVLSDRPAGERLFLEGLAIDLDISAPEGSTVHLVIDPLLGDVINAVGSGRIQLVRDEGEFSTFGAFNVSAGDYLFTAGEVFFRRFLIDSGSITWDGDPLNSVLDIAASFSTRASTEGLGLETTQGFIPLVIQMNVTGRVAAPSVDLALAIDRDDRRMIGGYEGIEAMLNQPERAAQYATSVLLTNSFLLTTSSESQLSDTRNQLAFNSLSQLVASQLNRYLNYALPNVDLNFGVQGESTQDLDVTYGVALRLLDERLIIRGQGIYQSNQLRRTEQGVLDEFVVEVRMNPRVSVEVFYRKEGDILTTDNTSTTGAGLSYQTEFSTWGRLMQRLFGWIVAPADEALRPEDEPVEEGDEDDTDGVVADRE